MIIGHKNVIAKLKKVIENNQVAHAYIFSGREGIGKKMVAMDFACNLLCDNEADKKMFLAGSHPDFKLIKPNEKGLIPVDDVRGMIENIHIKPIKSNYKIYIIDDAECMNASGQNSLLKTFEEPPEYAVIILITAKYNSLLTTIKSRGQLVEFSDLSNDEIKEYITNNNIKLPTDVDEKTLYALINCSITKISNVIADIEIIKELQKYVSNITKMKIIEINNFSNFLIKNKNNIQNVLDYLELLLYTNNSGTSTLLEYVEEAKSNIKRNINFEISIDNLLMKIKEASDA